MLAYAAALLLAVLLTGRSWAATTPGTNTGSGAFFQLSSTSTQTIVAQVADGDDDAPDRREFFFQTRFQVVTGKASW